MTSDALRLLAHIFAREPDAALAEAIKEAFGISIDDLDEAAAVYAQAFLLPKSISLRSTSYGFEFPGVESLEIALPENIPVLPLDHISRFLFIAAELEETDQATFLGTTLVPWVEQFVAACRKTGDLYETATAALAAILQENKVNS